MTCDQDHGYTHEQTAADHGAEDTYPASVGHNLSLTQCLTGFNFNGSPESVPAGERLSSGRARLLRRQHGHRAVELRAALRDERQHVRDELWPVHVRRISTSPQPRPTARSAARHRRRSTTRHAPRLPALTRRPRRASNITTSPTRTDPRGQPAAAGPGTTFSDADPLFDICSYLPSADGGDNRAPACTSTWAATTSARSSARRTSAGAGSRVASTTASCQVRAPAPTAQICSQSNNNVGGNTVIAYNPHHEPFQYYASTANPMHLPPTSVAMIGQNDQANHQYDIADFWAAANTGNLPSVSYLKAPDYQDGHAGYSDPTDEQTWLPPPSTTCSRCRAGGPPPSSSPTTTPTAGTTTCSARCSASRRPRWTR